MPTPRELLAAAKSEITEVAPSEAAAELSSATFLDVREGEEHVQGAVPGAVHIPRGQLEFNVEGRIPDRQGRVVVYCAGGVRSAFAARTLGDLGFTDVVSMAGGFNRWKDEGLPIEVPRTLDADQRERYHRHLLLPEIGETGQQRLLDAKVLLLGAGGLGSPAAMGGRAVSLSPVPPGAARALSAVAGSTGQPGPAPRRRAGHRPRSA